jgi:4-hydroxybutyryl-CoA dehydratase/vinylacetyl-CoA-Delta-isomerase
MGLKSVEEYKQSIRDGRTVYMDGEKVNDVTLHPVLKVGVHTASIDYAMADMPEYRDLAIVVDEKTGEPMSRYYYTPKSEEDLLKRHDLMVTGTRLGLGRVPFAKDIGSDSMNAVIVTAKVMRKLEYIERAQNFLTYLQKNDLSMAGTMTDVKGDRSLRPSDPKQEHPDYYVRVIDKGKEGIIVRGAKAHITGSPYFNELLVMPCRNMTEADADYAVSFAIPANSKGVIQIPHPIRYKQGSDEFPVDLPITGHTDALIIFKDVFIPWERVFLCGEWQFAMTLVYNFAYLHRHTAASYHIPQFEMLVGMAQLMAEYNGIEKIPHVREKIIDLVICVNTLKLMAKASCKDYVIHEGVPIPNPIISNLTKYHYAVNYHNCVRMVEDICGGLLSTAPTYKDWQNPETKEFVERYLGGKAGMSTEGRLRILQLIRDKFGVETDVRNLHAEGSLAAQRMTIYAESRSDIEEYKRQVGILAGIEKPV